MSKILISYRREDSADATGRIYDRLIQQFGRTAVFKDVDSIPLGINFRKHLDEQVAKCDVFLAVIGPDWMGIKIGERTSRLDDPHDFVRIEIESALKRQIPVIPVLVRGAAIPDPERLPHSLQELSDRNGIVVRHDPDFHRDMDRLIEYLRVQIEGTPDKASFPNTHHKTSDVNARTKETRSEIEPPRQERIDAAVPPSKANSSHRLVEPIEAPPATSPPSSQKTTDQSQSFVFGVIGLIVLIGAVAAFLILEPKPSPIEPIKYQPPQSIVETKEERPAQVTTPPPPTKPVEPTVVPRKQEQPVEKRTSTTRSSTPPGKSTIRPRKQPGNDGPSAGIALNATEYFGDGQLVLDLEATELSWVVVQVDNGSPQELLLRPGEQAHWKGQDQFILTLGNAGGVKAELNGKPQKPFGPIGTVARDIVLKP